MIKKTNGIKYQLLRNIKVIVLQIPDHIRPGENCLLEKSHKLAKMQGIHYTALVRQASSIRYPSALL
jgi:hypothetical protein